MLSENYVFFLFFFWSLEGMEENVHETIVLSHATIRCMFDVPFFRLSSVVGRLLFVFCPS